MFELALEHRGAGRHRQAVELCQQLYAADGRHHRAAFLIGCSTLEAGRAESAAKWLERALQLAPEAPEYLLQFALAQHRLGAKQRAANLLLRALQIKPDYTDASYVLGGI